MSAQQEPTKKQLLLAPEYAGKAVALLESEKRVAEERKASSVMRTKISALEADSTQTRKHVAFSRQSLQVHRTVKIRPCSNWRS